MRYSTLALTLAVALGACSASPSVGDDAGAVPVDGGGALDASCLAGRLGCACASGTCEEGTCVDGSCTACTIGSDGCACRSDGTCSAGLVCDGDARICVACTEGEEGCTCGSGCGEGLVCDMGLCVAVSCTDGATGCPCRATDPACDGHAFCDGVLCQACTADVAGCPCEGGECRGGLLCEDALCREPRSCGDLRAAGTCGAFEQCDEAPGRDAICHSGTCVPGYRWSSVSASCVACISADCSAEPTCAPDEPTSLDCGAHRLCVETDGVGECAGCEVGYADVGGDCVEVDLCGGVTCAEGEYCDTTRASGPTCTPWPCPDASTVVGSDGACSVRCTSNCAVPGATGRYWPYAAADDSCVCETLPGWYFDAGGEIRPVECDADRDGWVREEVRDILDASARDLAMIANARCAIRQVGAVELVDEYGVTSLIESCQEGLIQDRTDEECTVLPLRLFETKRNDVEGEAARLGEAPPYAAGGRRFRADELNSLTKACVTSLGDYDDDGFEDVSQFQPRPAESAVLGETARLRSFAHFVELYRVSFARAVEPSLFGRLVIAERSRCEPTFALRYGSDDAYDAPDGSTYWRNCERRRHPAFDADTGAPGHDFAQWSCGARAGSCPPPPMPAHRESSAIPDPDVSLLRGHGLCELGRVRPADGVWRGMHHHSQFQCVAVVADGAATRLYEREQRDFLATGTLVFDACRVTDCAGVEGCTDSRAPVTSVDAHDPVLSCAPRPSAIVAEGSVGWAALRYQPYGHVGASGGVEGNPSYRGGCINEDAEYPDLCPFPEFGRCATAATDAFGRYHCYGWESLFLWGDDDSAVRRSELVWAESDGEPVNMSVFNPESAPACM